MVEQVKVPNRRVREGTPNPAQDQDHDLAQLGPARRRRPGG